MPRSESLVSITEKLREFRRRIAPPGSSRERIARLFYVPIAGLVLNGRQMQPQPDPFMTPEIVYLEDLGVAECQYQPIRNILLLKLDHIGDLIVGMRAMRHIREGFPDARLTLVCASWNRTWAQQLGWFDRIVCFDFFSPLNRNWTVTEADLNALYDSVGSLQLETYDLAVDLRHDADTRPCLYRIDSKYRAGFYAPVHEGLPYLDLVLPMNEGISLGGNLSKSLHADLRLQVLAAAVVTAFAPHRPHPAEALVAPPLMTPRRGTAGRAFAVLAVGAGDPIRCWPIERYGDVGRELILRYGMDIVVVGGAMEQADAAMLASLLPRDRVQTVIGAPLAELPQLMAGAALCVCNGSGMSHLAAALGVPTVCILGGTTRMDVWHPAGANALSIGGKTPCQPCGLKQASECPWDVACLTVVSSAHVLGACERLLAARAHPVTAGCGAAG
jgi:ADP-heptose:LPS heptosyltransferase